MHTWLLTITVCQIQCSLISVTNAMKTALGNMLEQLQQISQNLTTVFAEVNSAIRSHTAIK